MGFRTDMMLLRFRPLSPGDGLPILLALRFLPSALYVFGSKGRDASWWAPWRGRGDPVLCKGVSFDWSIVWIERAPTDLRVPSSRRRERADFVRILEAFCSVPVLTRAVSPWVGVLCAYDALPGRGRRETGALRVSKISARRSGGAGG